MTKGTAGQCEVLERSQGDDAAPAADPCRHASIAFVDIASH